MKALLSSPCKLSMAARTPRAAARPVSRLYVSLILLVYGLIADDAAYAQNLDIQYTEGITFPTPNIYYSTGGSPPFNPDSNTPTNTNEPYLDWLNFVLAQSSIPQTFTTSYGDDEQTVSPLA